MKNLLILGANSDIAEAVAAEAAKKQISLILAGRNNDKLEALKSDLEIRFDAKVQIRIFDALDSNSHSQFYKDLPEKPDAVLCAFGYLGDQTTAQNDPAESAKIITTNFNGAVGILEIIALDFEQRKHGVIAGISSVAGERGRQSNYLYGAAKAGFSTYLSGLRNRLFKAGVHVVTIKPGFVKTKMIAGIDTPGPLTAEPDQVAKAILNAMQKKKNLVYVKGIWHPIMWVIRSIPEPIFKRLKF